MILVAAAAIELAGTPAACASTAPRTLPVVPASPSFWVPTASSTAAAHFDGLFTMLLVVAAATAVGTLAAMVMVTVRRGLPRGPVPPTSGPATRRLTRALTWTVLPLGLVAALLAGGVAGYLDLRIAPSDAIEIRVDARRYAWCFTYPNGISDGTLHVPIDTPVRLVLSSEDATHSLHLPDFRTKVDAVPGRETELWFEATRVGQFPAFCAEHCGPGHADMHATVVVHEPDGYEKWLETREQESMPKDPVELGAELYRKHACATCHSTDGRSLVGPTLRGLFGREVLLTDGTRLWANEGYLIESVLQPQAKIVKGYAPAMPTYQGRIDGAETAGLVEYMKTLR